jgi:hypothetical protein
MNSLISKLENIQAACTDQKAKKKVDDKDLDDFTRLRHKIAQEIKDVRTHLEERNKLLAQDNNNAATVKLSSDVRSRIKAIIKDIEQLDATQKSDKEQYEKKKAKGKKVEEGADKEFDHRAEVIELCWKHIDECKHLERSGFGMSGSGAMDSKQADKPLITELPDIEGDEGFQLLRKNDALIDQKLDVAADGVRIIKELATEMGKEIQTQTIMMEEIEDKVDRTQAHLDNLNRRLKTTLEKVRKGDKFILDFILLVIVLALGGFIYNLVA